MRVRVSEIRKKVGGVANSDGTEYRVIYGSPSNAPRFIYFYPRSECTGRDIGRNSGGKKEEKKKERKRKVKQALRTHRAHRL